MQDLCKKRGLPVTWGLAIAGVALSRGNEISATLDGMIKRRNATLLLSYLLLFGREFMAQLCAVCRKFSSAKGPKNEDVPILCLTGNIRTVSLYSHLTLSPSQLRGMINFEVIGKQNAIGRKADQLRNNKTGYAKRMR